LQGNDVLQRFRRARDELFRTHPQSPLSREGRTGFQGLHYFDPDPSFRIACRLEPAANGEPIEIDTGGEDGVINYRRVGRLQFTLGGQACQLTVFRLIGYAGGLFLPFRDATSGMQTYGGGRYLFDTVKGSDFVVLERLTGAWRVLLDFNYAYNPSCAYHYRWVCPLAPPENRVDVPIRAGEKKYAL
jgi:uncharacterized protein (DUF1684 family)